VRDGDSRTIRIKAGVPEIFLAEFRWAAGADGPSKHIHKQHCDAFYVQDGRLSLFVGDSWRELEPGDFALVPPGVGHTFRNDSAGEVRFLNLHVPDCGFADNLRGRRDHWDQFDAPEDGGRALDHEPPSVAEIELEAGEQTRVTGHYYVLEGESAGTAAFRCRDELVRGPVRALTIA
jgi:quercetin dioxygenase-like cupin family protein